MSCPDWRALTRRREAEPGDPPAWRSALHHLDRCPACQETAPAFDPTLVFRRLPAAEVGSDGIEEMKRAVASMRRGRTIEHRQRPRVRPWLRAAAVAAVAVGSLLLRGAGSAPDGVAPEAAPASLAPVAVESEVDLWHMPLVETADPIYGSIIQVVDDDISVVLVVPTEADV